MTSILVASYHSVFISFEQCFEAVTFPSEEDRYHDNIIYGGLNSIQVFFMKLTHG